jgi:hypothetical protein
MPKKRDIHVVPHPDGWAVERELARRPSAVTDTKQKAEEHAREIARREKVEVVIHRRDGTIQDSDSYGRDPSPPRDRKH